MHVFVERRLQRCRIYSGRQTFLYVLYYSSLKYIYLMGEGAILRYYEKRIKQSCVHLKIMANERTHETFPEGTFNTKKSLSLNRSCYNMYIHFNLV